MYHCHLSFLKQWSQNLHSTYEIIMVIVTSIQLNVFPNRIMWRWRFSVESSILLVSSSVPKQHPFSFDIYCIPFTRTYDFVTLSCFSECITEKLAIPYMYSAVALDNFIQVFSIFNPTRQRCIISYDYFWFEQDSADKTNTKAT